MCCVTARDLGEDLESTFTILEEDEDLDVPLIHVAYELPFSHSTDEGESSFN